MYSELKKEKKIEEQLEFLGLFQKNYIAKNVLNSTLITYFKTLEWRSIDNRGPTVRDLMLETVNDRKITNKP